MERREQLERLKLSASASRLIRSARVAHLATADSSGKPHVIPICFAFDGKEFFSAIDEKPKRSPPQKLKRLSNIRENSRVALVIDHYDDDWRRLAYLLVVGKARVLTSGKKHGQAVLLLRRKYPQYRRMAIDKGPMIVVRPKRVVSWGRL